MLHCLDDKTILVITGTSKKMNETNLVERIMNHDAAAFKELYEKCKAPVYNTCLSYLQNIPEAEEATQDTFVEVHRSIRSYRSDSSLSTWIYRIAVNKCLDTLRHRKRKKRFGLMISLLKKGNNNLQADVPHFDHPGVVLENKEKAHLLFTIINTLPDQQKTAFILSQVEDLPQKEVAAIMQTSEKAVESLIQRAKANLRKELEIFNPSRRKSKSASSKQL